jgi:hypothetical protein
VDDRIVLPKRFEDLLRVEHVAFYYSCRLRNPTD